MATAVAVPDLMPRPQRPRLGEAGVAPTPPAPCWKRTSRSYQPAVAAVKVPVASVVQVGSLISVVVPILSIRPSSKDLAKP